MIPCSWPIRAKRPRFCVGWPRGSCGRTRGSPWTRRARSGRSRWRTGRPGGWRSRCAGSPARRGRGAAVTGVDACSDTGEPRPAAAGGVGAAAAVRAQAGAVHLRGVLRLRGDGVRGPCWVRRALRPSQAARQRPSRELSGNLGQAGARGCRACDMVGEHAPQHVSAHARGGSGGWAGSGDRRAQFPCARSANAQTCLWPPELRSRWRLPGAWDTRRQRSSALGSDR